VVSFDCESLHCGRSQPLLITQAISVRSDRQWRDAQWYRGAVAVLPRNALEFLYRIWHKHSSKKSTNTSNIMRLAAVFRCLTTVNTRRNFRTKFLVAKDGTVSRHDGVSVANLEPEIVKRLG